MYAEVFCGGMEKNQEPVFPRPYPYCDAGLTKREYAAIQIMAGYAANTADEVVGDISKRAQWAVKEADTLLATLAK